MFGYAGQYLYVNLTKHIIERIILDNSRLEKYIGGMGVNLKLMQEYSKARVAELSEDNIVVIGTGPLVGTSIPGSSKLFVTTKFPLTHCIGTGAAGMSFGQMMKRAGFDHIVIEGRSETPTYLLISNEEVELKNAEGLWGSDICQATSALWKEHGDESSVMAIGPAGERLVRMSMALVDNIASIGKGGLAAVLGSKNLKAIVALGDESIRIADPIKYKEAISHVFTNMKTSPKREVLMSLGSMAGWEHWAEIAGIPYKDSTEIYPRETLRKKYGPKVYLEKINKGKIGCPSCFIPCKEKFWFKNEDNMERMTFASSFIGRITAFGARCNVGTPAHVLDCHDLCNRLGLDTYSVSASIDYVINLYEDGIITKKETGYQLRRDFKTTKRLIEQIAYRDGIGSKLAEGFETYGQYFGRTFESQIKGCDFIFDARNYRLGTYEFEQVVNPRGGHQHAGGSPTYGARNVSIDILKSFCKAIEVPPSSIEKIFFSENEFNVARLTKHCEDWYSVFSILGVCSRKSIKGFYTMDLLSQLYTYVTGIPLEKNQLKAGGERAWNLLKMLNVAEGFTRAKDVFPASWFKPLKDGKKSLTLQDYYGKKNLELDDLNNLLNDYYDEHGWCLDNGIPTKKKILELGLEKEAAALRNE
jgi:aldehyde:ferredoxin oxidoreductase